MIGRDALGRPVSLAAPLQKVLSLSPATTENLFAMGAGKYLVGRTTACDYPPESQKIPTVGDFYRPTLERIITLQPQLVVLDSNTITTLEADALQKKLRAPVFVFQTKHYSDVSQQLSIMATWFPEKPIKDATQRHLSALLSAQKRAQSRKKSALRAFLEIYETPLCAAGEGAFVTDLLVLLGVQNAVKGSNPYPQISREQLFILNPDLYIIAASVNIDKKRHFDSPLDKMEAVKKGRVYTLPADHLLRPTPRLAQGLERLAKLLPS
jgi:iron complex transport system substrate-binding protein